ncbi:hypothetical protein CMO92_04475 [Candidatus Woesearchaeota archaeon]|nr:hypothetical protein [Candidatus Woesearchaeota archaeon]
MKRAQAAMEFLMTYGWAILVVLAAIGALAYFGVLSPDSLLPERCTGPAGLDCLERASIIPDGLKLNGVLDVENILIVASKNNLGQEIEITEIPDPTGNDHCSEYEGYGIAWDFDGVDGIDPEDPDDMIVLHPVPEGPATISDGVIFWIVTACKTPFEPGRFKQDITVIYKSENGLDNRAAYSIATAAP